MCPFEWCVVAFHLSQNSLYPRHYHVEIACALMEVGESEERCHERVAGMGDGRPKERGRGKGGEDVGGGGNGGDEVYMRHKIWPLWR